MTFQDREVVRLLLVIDLENDFAPGGALPPDLSKTLERWAKQTGLAPSFLQDNYMQHLVSMINALLKSSYYKRRVASREVHQSGNVSFFVNHEGKKFLDEALVNGLRQRLYYRHTEQGTWGAEFVPGLLTDMFDIIQRKAWENDVDSPSAVLSNPRADGSCVETPLLTLCRFWGVTDIDLAGCDFDICVFATAIDLAKAGFKVRVLIDYCLLASEMNREKATADLRAAGVEVIEGPIH